LPHATDVRPAQLPEKSCSRTLAGADDKVIVGLVDWATKLYQTSFLSAVPHPIGEMVLYVAPAKVPPVFTHDAAEVSVTAPEQRSFDGGVISLHVMMLVTVVWLVD
jgi:hypothetical protein